MSPSTQALDHSFDILTFGFLSWCHLLLHSFTYSFIIIIFWIFEFYFIFLYCRSLLVINFIHISVHMSIPISQFITPPPPPPCHFPPLVSIRLFSTSVSQFLPCKPVHLYRFSRFHLILLLLIRYLLNRYLPLGRSLLVDHINLFLFFLLSKRTLIVYRDQPSPLNYLRYEWTSAVLPVMD